MTIEAGPNDSDFITPGEPASDENEDEALLSHDLGDELDDGDENDQPKDDDQPTDEEFEEIERNGKKARIPAWLKPELMMQQDYTRKTQEVAEERRAAEQERVRIQEAEQRLASQFELQKTFTKEIAQLHNVDEQLARYSQVDWKAWENQDYMAANAAWKDWHMLKDQRHQIVGGLQQKEHQYHREQEQRTLQEQQAAKAEFAKRQEQTLNVVKREIPSWNAETAGKVSEFAQRHGYTPQELVQATTDPRAFILLYKAYKGEQSEIQQKQALAKAKVHEPAQPLTTIANSRKAPVRAGLSDDLSADEWARRRRAQRR